MPYKRVSVTGVSLWMLGKVVWFFLRQIKLQRAGELWWTSIHFLQVLLTGIHFAILAWREDADYYHAHDFETLLPAIVAAKIRRRPVAYDAHELVSEQGDPRSLRKRMERVLEARFVPHVDALIVPNQSRARLYQQRCRLRMKPTIILNCPPTVTLNRPGSLRQQLGLESSVRLVLYHGTFMSGRALEELLRAARNFDPGIVLVMIGEQNEFYQQVLRPLWESERLADRVVFLPHIPPDEVMSYVASADLGVVIYKNINLNNYLCAPTKLYEYVMLGVPIVACAFPEMLDFLEQYPAGLSFDPDSPASIADAVNEFFRSEAEQRPTIEQALKLARERFNWERESEKLLALFALPDRAA